MTAKKAAKGKKTDIQTIISINDLIPDKTSIRSLKIVCILLHCYRIITRFMTNPVRLKKALVSCAQDIEKRNAKYFSVNVFDCASFALSLAKSGINRAVNYAGERQEHVAASLSMPAFNSVQRLLNTRNNDHKAVDKESGKLLQQIAANANSINKLEAGEISKGTCDNTSYFFIVQDDVIAEFAANLERYLAGSIKAPSMTRYIDKVIRN